MEQSFYISKDRDVNVWETLGKRKKKKRLRWRDDRTAAHITAHNRKLSIQLLRQSRRQKAISYVSVVLALLSLVHCTFLYNTFSIGLTMTRVRMDRKTL